MPDITGAMLNVKYLDELSRQNNFINKLHPLVKLIVTLVYIAVLASFNRYEITGLLPFVLYPVTVAVICDIPAKKLLKRIIILEPFIMFAGILNPILDKSVITIGELTFSSGWLTFFSLIIKSTLMILAGFLLIATTGIDDIAGALSMIRVPSVFILLFLLTYRYIFVLMDEAGRLQKAYTLRAPQQKSIRIQVWGTMIGQLLIRTYNRAQTIFQSMVLKGYNGRYNIGTGRRFRTSDIVYLTVWIVFTASVRMINIPMLITDIISRV